MHSILTLLVKLKPMLKYKINKLASELLETFSKTSDNERYFLGITGCPAAGKSELANALSGEINSRTGSDLVVVVPMDGFHFPNSTLKERDLLQIKGAAETFDANRFVELINRLYEFPDQITMCPAYDRVSHNPVEDSITIKPSNRLIIVEGNYLLLNRSPWNLMRTKLDEVWYLDTPFDTIKERLFDRHVSGGTTRKEAERKIMSVDIPNAGLIRKTCSLADKIVCLGN